MKLYILGGRPCSGKTSLAYHLGLKFSIPIEHTDIFVQTCIDNASVSDSDLYPWRQKTLVELFQGEPDKLFLDYLTLYRVLLPEYIEYLKNKDEDELILEAAFFLPEFIPELKRYFDVRICYTKSSDGFVRERYVKRNYVLEMLEKETGHQALENLLQRDVLFSEYIESFLVSGIYPALHVDSEKAFDRNLDFVAKIFELE